MNITSHILRVLACAACGMGSGYCVCSEELMNLKRYETPSGHIVLVRERFAPASCNRCGWLGSTQDCPVTSVEEEENFHCPKCGQIGADVGYQAKSAKELP